MTFSLLQPADRAAPAPVSIFTDVERAALLADLKLLADATRLRLLERLLNGERCVCHLVEDTGLSQGTISHHMSLLRRAGWVRDRRDPNDYRWTHYSLVSERAQELSALLGRLLNADAPERPDPGCSDLTPVPFLPKEN